MSPIFWTIDMPRRNICQWTRKLEYELVEFVRKRDFIWQYTGNTNHHIQQKYKAYAEFAATLGPGFTARSVRDRWVNIRNTFNYNLRKVERSRETAKSATDVYIPTWPLWKPLQFLRETSKKEDGLETLQPVQSELNQSEVKEEPLFEMDLDIGLRQRVQQTNRPRRRLHRKRIEKSCSKVLHDLIKAVKPLINDDGANRKYQYFGRYVSEQLNSMKSVDAEAASKEILRLFDSNVLQVP